jgi:hypothetical protein
MARGGRFGVIPEDVQRVLLAHADRPGPAPEQATQLANVQQMADAAIGAGLSEDEVQKLIVGVLERAGYRVLITSRRVKKCWKCGAWPRSGAGDGVSRSLADLQVRHPSWPRAMWVALEVKRAGPIRWKPEQRQAAQDREIIVVQSVAEALAAVHISLTEDSNERTI